MWDTMIGWGNVRLGVAKQKNKKRERRGRDISPLVALLKVHVRISYASVAIVKQ